MFNSSNKSVVSSILSLIRREADKRGLALNAPERFAEDILGDVLEEIGREEMLAQEGEAQAKIWAIDKD